MLGLRIHSSFSQMLIDTIMGILSPLYFLLLNKVGNDVLNLNRCVCLCVCAVEALQCQEAHELSQTQV